MIKKTLLSIQTALLASSSAAILAYAPLAAAHHSFAAYDITQNIEFDGTVATLKFRNPHIEMTLKRKNKDGKVETIHFVDGAPANMLARMGLLPNLIKPGTTITAIGSPRKDNGTEYFLKTIILSDGRKFESLKKPTKKK